METRKYGSHDDLVGWSQISQSEANEILRDAKELRVSVNSGSYEELDERENDWDLRAVYQADSLEVRDSQLPGYTERTLKAETGKGDLYRIKALL